MPNKRYIKPEHRVYESVASILARGRARGIVDPDPYLFENRKRIQRRASKAYGESRVARLRRMADFHPDAREVLEGQPSPAGRNPPGTRALAHIAKLNSARATDVARLASERAARDERRGKRLAAPAEVGS